jgi:hypothetical protein
LREALDERGTKPVIPNRCNRKQPFSFNKRLYKLRWRIENAFNRLKDFRRIATRYDKLAQNYLASVCLAAALVWCKLWQTSTPLADLLTPLFVANPFSAVRASFRRQSSDERDDGVPSKGVNPSGNL